MLLQERMKKYNFSNNEKLVIDYILNKQELIKDYTTKMIANETYTSPSILIRIAKKLGFSGWNEFKEYYLEEIKYLQSHFNGIDANFPFTNQDTIMNIASKIANLHIESAQDTLSLLCHNSLQKALQIINESKEIKVFCIGNINYIGEEFVFKLNRINKRASIVMTQDNMFHYAAMTSPKDCAICISYSGETPTLLKTVNLLKNNNIPIIAITSVGNNTLSNTANITLNITTREKSYSKIAGFTSLESISLILNILYSCLFSLNYQENLDFKLSIAKRIEGNRVIDNTIVKED
ncbi:MurR/RpiR family transcriptional regulator [Clostridium neonatale]|uniref:MurR/RpiR family transcriptional regulator n=1 Tax=Clostridium neonatale TaxID=137838 RepID=UPI00291C32E2|nr:MurR/RpiR family transcriptional regulator [Clostridium neonatale]CAI3706162.1 MurR/RpiR family transcriptional regulator [Clostridium neonatale]